MWEYGEYVEKWIEFNGRRFERGYYYMYAEWHGFHTNNEGEGLWDGDRQIIGTGDFSVRGCQTLKAAKAKIRAKCKRLHRA